jgi:hypothetical protein
MELESDSYAGHDALIARCDELAANHREAKHVLADLSDVLVRALRLSVAAMPAQQPPWTAPSTTQLLESMDDVESTADRSSRLQRDSLRTQAKILEVLRAAAAAGPAPIGPSTSSAASSTTASADSTASVELEGLLAQVASAKTASEHGQRTRALADHLKTLSGLRCAACGWWQPGVGRPQLPSLRIVLPRTTLGLYNGQWWGQQLRAIGDTAEVRLVSVGLEQATDKSDDKSTQKRHAGTVSTLAAGLNIALPTLCLATSMSGWGTHRSAIRFLLEADAAAGGDAANFQLSERNVDRTAFGTWAGACLHPLPEASPPPPPADPESLITVTNLLTGAPGSAQGSFRRRIWHFQRNIEMQLRAAAAEGRLTIVWIQAGPVSAEAARAAGPRRFDLSKVASRESGGGQAHTASVQDLAPQGWRDPAALSQVKQDKHGKDYKTASKAGFSFRCYINLGDERRYQFVVVATNHSSFQHSCTYLNELLLLAVVGEGTLYEEREWVRAAAVQPRW